MDDSTANTGRGTSSFRPGITLPEIDTYLDGLHLAASHDGDADELLARMRDQADAEDIPIVSSITGRLLALLAHATRPARVVEFGTAIGYSTTYIARALPATSTLTSFEIDPVRHEQARANLAESGARCTLDLQLRDAREGIREIDGNIDFAFLDAGKGDYPEYLEQVLERLTVGGLVAVDNALMHGTAATGVSDGHWSDEQIAAIRAFNESFTTDDRMHAMVLPVGDGLGLGVRVEA